MEFLTLLQPDSFFNTIICLASAFLLGGLIGFERQLRQRTAGLKTNILVAVGAAVFVSMAARLFGHEGAIRVASYVVSGIGFLGAGIIMREAGSVVGLNTAATLWCSAAVGCCCGGSLIAEAFAASLFVLAANTFLGPMVNRINRRPIGLADLEGVCAVHVITERPAGKETMTFFWEQLKLHDIHIRRLEMRPFGNDLFEIEAIIAISSTDAGKLDRLVETVSSSNHVALAFWSRGASG